MIMGYLFKLGVLFYGFLWCLVYVNCNFIVIGWVYGFIFFFVECLVCFVGCRWIIERDDLGDRDFEFVRGIFVCVIVS